MKILKNLRNDLVRLRNLSTEKTGNLRNIPVLEKPIISILSVYFFDKIWQILTTVQCRARTYAQLLLVFVIMMTPVDASQPTEVHIHRKRILPVFSGKKSWKKLFCFVVDKNRLFLVKCASVISSVKQKKKWKKTKEIFVTFHLWFEIWSR